MAHALFLRLLCAELASISGSSPGELIPNAETLMAGCEVVSGVQVYLGPWNRKISGFPNHGVMRDLVGV